MNVPVLRAARVRKEFPLTAGLWRRGLSRVRAVDGVDLEIQAGECLALVGESGSGKTTLGRCLLRLLEPTSGEIFHRGEDLLALPAGPLRRRRRHFQMIFQDPFGSLNPRMRLGQILAEPMRAHRLAFGAERRSRVAELLSVVGLPPGAAERYPHQFSGGQRQRIGIARALATEPELVVADEPVSALDVSSRAQIMRLLAELRARFGLAMIFIGHDLAVVGEVAERIAVIYRGRIVEEGPAASVLGQPRHPYTAALIAAAPRLEARPPGARLRLAGEPPDPAAPREQGCPFHPRCAIARERCREEAPALTEAAPQHRAACHFPDEASDLLVNPGRAGWNFSA